MTTKRGSRLGVSQLVVFRYNHVNTEKVAKRLKEVRRPEPKVQ